ncbi:hypothetical protein Shyd_58390 [Streptomyces hydrogenans]|uniref:Uncharacterized protein n=1 Tax=Streptomyces hydrogenans TaxID=1873719 RepID=A0ABQ3PHG1_9ACTN|nr:hypothetical protein Shyd_58390 [Streptomyces hydrogenans]
MAVNEKTPGANMRALHALAPGLVKAGPATARPPTRPRLRPHRPRPVSSAGYRRALEAHRQPVQPVPGAPRLPYERWERRSIGYHEERCSGRAA